MKPAHSHAPISTSTVTSQTVATGGSPSITPSSTAASTMAVSTRSLSTARSLLRLRARQAETALATRERDERVFEVLNAEIGPQRLADVKLGIREIPEKEVADAVITARADEEVGVGHVAQLQLPAKTAFVDRVDGQRAAGHLRRETSRCLHDVPTSAVTH